MVMKRIRPRPTTLVLRGRQVLNQRVLVLDKCWTSWSYCQASVKPSGANDRQVLNQIVLVLHKQYWTTGLILLYEDFRINRALGRSVEPAGVSTRQVM
ncbi:hypothetical protein RRG08_012283 [Elysia crispata]|uniref:Uncharacterized protein n=1 Tax=Elysia crispata TaxID=231223 RepID=A0AAE1EE94_9GAST|nr:hypothetical protein RRG08_012283 [Elysia crispata]